LPRYHDIEQWYHGTWSPALNNTATTTYTFTPTADSVDNTTLTITVNPNILPTFNAVAPICSGATFAITNNIEQWYHGNLVTGTQ
jgi:hypothetical protein